MGTYETNSLPLNYPSSIRNPEKINKSLAKLLSPMKIGVFSAPYFLHKRKEKLFNNKNFTLSQNVLLTTKKLYYYPSTIPSKICQPLSYLYSVHKVQNILLKIPIGDFSRAHRLTR